MTEDGTTVAAHADQGTRKHRRAVDFARVRARAGGIAEAVVRWFGTLVALLMVAQVVLSLGGANPDNGITRFDADWTRPLALGFADLFTPADPQAGVLVNYGVAALFWLLATSLAVRIIRAVR